MNDKKSRKKVSQGTLENKQMQSRPKHRKIYNYPNNQVDVKQENMLCKTEVVYKTTKKNPLFTKDNNPRVRWKVYKSNTPALVLYHSHRAYTIILSTHSI